MKTTRMKLNVAFKEFQRLPEWPIVIKLADRPSSLDQPEGRKTVAAPAFSDDDFRPQSFAE